MSLDVLVFILASLVYVEIVTDFIQTVKALEKGGVELNPVSAWLQKKLGQAGATFAAAVGFTALLAAFTDMSSLYGVIFSSIVAALEGANVIRNFFQLKKMGVKFF